MIVFRGGLNVGIGFRGRECPFLIAVILCGWAIFGRWIVIIGGR